MFRMALFSSMSTKCLQGWQRSGAGAAATWLFTCATTFFNFVRECTNGSGSNIWCPVFAVRDIVQI